ncbi:MAG: MOSC N-terminal beta barrel domain-containing protein [Bacteroidota bacterium]
MPILKLSQIFIYPIKSLAGISLEIGHVEEHGLRYDRRWMLVDEHGQFITQRKYPNMALLRLRMDEDHLYISSPEKGVEDLELSLAPTLGDSLEVTVWDDTCIAYHVSSSADEWFTRALGMSCRLVYKPNDSIRKIKAQWALNSESVSFADGYPYLIVGQASLDDLNDKLENPISMIRFRPNFVFTGGQSYEEFQWSTFSIGNNHFQGLKPCVRCVLTTINPETGEKGKEPLTTLAKQKIDEKVVFGQHAIAVDHGEVKLGDDVYVVSRKESPYAPLNKDSVH